MESSSENKYGVQGVILLLLVIGGAIGSSVLQGKDSSGLISQGIQAAVLAGLMLCCLLLKKEHIFACLENKRMITVSLCLSVILAVLPGLPVETPFYLAGGILVAMVCDMGCGAFLAVLLATLHISVAAPAGASFVVLLMQAMAFSLLAVWLRKKGNVVWVLVCAETLTAVLTLFWHDLLLDAACQKDLMWQLLGTLCLFGIVLFCGHWCMIKEEEVPTTVLRAEETTDVKVTEVTEDAAITEESAACKETAVSKELATPEESIVPEEPEGPLAYESELLDRLQAELPRVYRHSAQVAELSAKAAISIGADAVLCEAAGWYHEIGRLVDKKDYIAAGVRLIEEHQLPFKLCATVKQTSGKLEMPKSPEAAIVMISEGILSTIQFLKIKQETVAMDKIVENNFQIRLMKGVLDETGLSLKDYTTLKRFYLLELAEEKV